MAKVLSRSERIARSRRYIALNVATENAFNPTQKRDDRGRWSKVPGFDLNLKAALTTWKASASNLTSHLKSLIQGKPVSEDGNSKERRVLAETLLKAVLNGKPAPTLYRGDNKDPQSIDKPLLGWTSDKSIAKKWARKYRGKVYKLDGAVGLEVASVPGVFNQQEAEWIIPHKLPKDFTLNVFCPTGPGGGVDPTCSPKGKKLHPTETVAFKKWFGKSKVVDKDGKPLVCYHGTDTEFNSFKASGRRRLIYASPYPEQAELYGVGSEQRILPVYVSIKNPVYIYGRDSHSYDLKPENDGAIAFHWLEGKAPEGNFGPLPSVSRKYAESVGRPIDSEGRVWFEVSVREPTQIKSAIGNKGTFDPNDPLLTNARKKPINPLRSDPSRTTTLRRGFEEQLQKRLSSFSQSLVKLLVADKALGITANVFCPTGEGGGVDPTCSPKGKKSVKKKSKVVWFSQDDEEMDYDLAEEALQVAKLSGINILSDKELTAATIEGGKVTGALFTGLSGDVYSFDVAVDPAHQGKGIGSQLTDLGLQNFANYSEMGASIKLDAVNPQMVEMLKRRGFSVTQQFGGHQIMERLTANAPNWSFDTPQSKIDNFEQWIISKLSETMNEKDIHSGVNWWQLYIERAYKLGAGRTFDEVRKRGTIKKPEWYQGTKEQFLSSSFNNPVSVDRLKILVGRTHKALKGFTEAMRSQLTQELTDGLIQGLSPREIAKNLTKRIGINKHRAMTIARTEIVRSHAEGQLASLRALGINEIGVDVEFTTARNPCPICNKLKGKVFTIAQAEGLIPRHPNCFIGPGVKIYTVDGWKPIASIKVGDLVLTHQGRFRKVTQLHRNTGTDVHVVEFRIKGSGTNSQIKITSEHPVMVNKTWRPAREIQVGHKVRWMSSACQGCGKPIPYGRKYHNQTCQWMDPTQVQNLGEKITKSLNEQYESGRRDRKQTVKAAHEKIYQLSLQGKFRRKPASTERNGAKQPEARKKISQSKLGSLNPMKMYPSLRRELSARMKDQHERDPKSHINYKLSLKARKGNLESLTDIELKMYQALARRKVQAEYNYPVDSLWIDFAIPEHKIAIECDGEYWHKKEVDDVRDKRLQELGWTVLRFKGKRINRNVEGCVDQVERLLKNHEGEYTFCDFEVVEVIHRDIAKTQLYNFSVEEDESYIAKGCVVHNCKCAFIPHVSSVPSPQKEYRRKSIESSILSITRKNPLVGNVFCPTGEGGGVDPTCSPAQRRQLISSLDSMGFSKKTLSEVEAWGKSLKWKGPIPKLSGKFDKADMKVLNEMKDKVLRDLGFTASSKPAGYCHVASVMMWDMLGRPEKLLPTQFNAVNAPNGDVHFALYFYSPGWKNPWVIDPTGAQYGYKVFTDKSVIDKMGYSTYKKVAAYYAPVKLSVKQIQDLRLEAYLSVNRVRDPAGPNRLVTSGRGFRVEY